MNGIIGFSKLLSEPDLPESKREEFLKILHNSTHYLLSVITDIVEISKIESGSMQPNHKKFELDSLFDDIYNESVCTFVKEKNITLIINKKSPEISLISTDEVKLKQIILNLVSNAVKYTDKGSVTIEYQVNKNNRLEIKVIDTGVGIDKKYHDIIFERFRQGDRELATKKGGTGLGLSITKSYVTMLEGEIELESEPGKGAIFTVTIPIQVTHSGKPQNANTKNNLKVHGSEIKVLIAEDQFINFLFLEEILAEFKFSIIHAKDGQEALDLFQNNPNINLILLDMKMPRLDGYQVIKKIREVNSQIPIIAQTAYALSEDHQKIQKVGFSDYITKPINKDELLTLISKYLN